MQAWNFIQKETLTQMFSCEFCQISKDTFFTEYLRATASNDYRGNVWDSISHNHWKEFGYIWIDSFARGYHMYMDIWNPLIGMILRCKRESTNEMDKHAITTMRSNSLGKESSVVGHSRKCFKIFLDVSYDPIHFNWSWSCRQKAKPWRWPWSRNSN